MTNNFLGYHPGESYFHKMNATIKLACFFILTIASMITYDTRFLILIMVLSLIAFYQAQIKYRQIKFIIKLVAVFAILNLLFVYLFAPNYGVSLYQSKTVWLHGWGSYQLTAQQFFYEFNLLLKYFSTIPIALIFILTTNPSEFASSLNQLGISYKISYAFSLALRYIPDIQEDYQQIKMAQQARGLEISSKGRLLTRIKGNLQIVLPLILTSFERIEVISNAMELRRFGYKKKRTWYTSRPIKRSDWLALIICVVLLILSFSLFFINHSRYYNPFL